MVKEITAAVVYMHGKNIIHRDLKPENLLLTYPLLPSGSKSTKPTVKIIDFGLSKILEPPTPRNTSGPGVARSFLGTRGYLAPEMLQRRSYSLSVDVWALGVIVFVLLCGCLPFDDEEPNPQPRPGEPHDQGCAAAAASPSKFVLRFPRWAANLSASSKDLLLHLLDPNPRTRYSAKQAFRHPWVRGKGVGKGYLESPKIIRTPGSVRREGEKAGKTRNRIDDLVNGRRREQKIEGSPSPSKPHRRKNSF